MTAISIRDLACRRARAAATAWAASAWSAAFQKNPVKLLAKGLPLQLYRPHRCAARSTYTIREERFIGGEFADPPADFR